MLINDGYPLTRVALYELLRKRGDVLRRYFYPCITEMRIYHGLASELDQNLMVTMDAGDRIPCLPLYDGLAPEYQLRVRDLFAEAPHA